MEGYLLIFKRGFEDAFDFLDIPLTDVALQQAETE